MIILVVSVPIGFALTQSPTLVTLLKGIAICLAIMMTIIITFFDPLVRIIKGKEPRQYVSTGRSGTSGLTTGKGTNSGVSVNTTSQG